MPTAASRVTCVSQMVRWLIVYTPTRVDIDMQHIQPGESHGHTVHMSKQSDWSVPCDSCVTNGWADCTTHHIQPGRYTDTLFVWANSLIGVLRLTSYSVSVTNGEVADCDTHFNVCTHALGRLCYEYAPAPLPVSQPPAVRRARCAPAQ